MPATRSPRSYAPLTDEQLARLSELADANHVEFTRSSGRKHDWADRRVAVVLAQGAAAHYLDGITGVKDLDVWTFYASIPGEPLGCGQYQTHADFGPSDHGRQEYAAGFVHPQLSTWLAYEGRRVDFLVRELPVTPGADVDKVTDALRAWLAKGAQATPQRNGKLPSASYLSRQAMVWIAPGSPGTVIWPVSVTRASHPKSRCGIHRRS